MGGHLHITAMIDNAVAISGTVRDLSTSIHLHSDEGKLFGAMAFPEFSDITNFESSLNLTKSGIIPEIINELNYTISELN